jgi:eukaryotic-like serine/threonine-protein kinase
VTLARGTKFGPYEIGLPLGAGGMGEVYRASDSRLARDVALKVLPGEFARDAERMARFEREAKILASLNHPNIASIYGLEDSAGVQALVMELVEGPTLAERLKRGNIPLDEALPIGKQICEALEYAHERGIVHRDLKPSNIKLAANDVSKVLDFGLAKAIEGDASAVDISTSPTISRMATQAGIILGTAAYMSPEQAKGKPVDRRTDIWSFGCVLYEMLTGKLAFQGATISETLAAVIRDEPEWTALPPNTPRRIRELLRRCLTKDPKQRLQAIGDARIAIEEVLASGGAGEEAAPVENLVPGWRRVLPWAVLAVGACVAILLSALRPAPRALPLRKFQRSVENLRVGWPGWGPTISPDGKKAAYQGGDSIFVWEFDQLEPHKVFEMEGPGELPATPVIWSPDSASLAFRNREKFLRVPAAGGQPVQLCRLPFREMLSGAWSNDGRIYLASHIGDMYEVSDGGGDAKPLGLLHPSTEVDFHTLSMLPDGHLMYMVHTAAPGTRVDVLINGKPKTIFSSRDLGGAIPAYSPDGYLLLDHDGHGIWAHPFSLSRMELTGEPFLIAAKGTLPSVSSDGTLFYLLPEPDELCQAVWAGRDGKVVSTVGEQHLGLMYPALSPDGKKLAVAAVDEDGKEFISIDDLARGVRIPLTTDSQTIHDFTPLWTPDGRILFSYFDNIFPAIALRAADGTGSTQKLFQAAWPHFSPGGNFLEFTTFAPEAKLGYLRLDRGKLPPDPLKPVVFLDDSSYKTELHLSPDEQLAAYLSPDPNGPGIFITRFPSGEGRWEVTAKGESPIWNPRGGELLFTSNGSVMSVQVTAKPSLTLSVPKKLFDLDKTAFQTAYLSGRALYDVSPDGQRFLMVQRVGKHDTSRTMVVVQNWLAEFAKKNRN